MLPPVDLQPCRHHPLRLPVSQLRLLKRQLNNLRPGQLPPGNNRQYVLVLQERSNLVRALRGSNPGRVRCRVELRQSAGHSLVLQRVHGQQRVRRCVRGNQHNLLVRRCQLAWATVGQCQVQLRAASNGRAARDLGSRCVRKVLRREAAGRILRVQQDRVAHLELSNHGRPARRWVRGQVHVPLDGQTCCRHFRTSRRERNPASRFIRASRPSASVPPQINAKLKVSASSIPLGSGRVPGAAA